jgi:hypothetical protein
LAAVAAVDQLHGYAFVVLAPEIGRSLGWSASNLATVALLRGVGFAAVAAAVGAAARRGLRLRRLATAGAVTRAAALAVGSVAAGAPFAAGIATYGAGSSTVAGVHHRLADPADREAQRMIARLGNVAAPVAVGGLALFLSWPIVMVSLALVSLAVAVAGAPGTDIDRGEDVADSVARRFAAIPGGRFTLWVITAGAVAELPLHVVLFMHLGHLNMSVPARAALAALGELAGVVANLALGRRMSGVRPRSPALLALGTLVAVAAGIGALVVAITATTLAVAVAAVAVGAVAMSVAIPFLAVGTRAALAGSVPSAVPIAAAAGLAVALGVGPAGGAAVVAVLAILPFAGAIAVFALVVRAPGEVAAALADVANVTPDPRMPVGPKALEQA